MRKELKIGLLLLALTLTVKQFTLLPEAVTGFLLGLAICFEVVGVLPENVYRKLKRMKRSLFVQK